MPESDTQNAQDPPGKKRRSHHSCAATQAVQIQRILWKSLKSDGLKPADLSGLARAWCDVNEERRKLRMQPLPKSVDTTKTVKRGRSRGQAPVEPSEPSEPKAAPTPPPVV